MARFHGSGPTMLALLLTASGCSVGASGGREASPEPARFMAALTPPQGAETEASGTAEFDFDGTTVEYVINVADITGATAAHIHQAGTRLVIVPIHVDRPTSDSTGVLVTGTFTAADVSASSPVAFNELIELMRTGGAYVNVHTQANPGGEIRGEIGVAARAASRTPARDSTGGRPRS